ncbi:hypothetical protein RND71_026500 [Anisodus tanguticus]|uniref:Uncharacterized protein n=1 Tax=Anisodus tanguticus TaxID=243964 RepID=A0AAE1RNQ1_9SOLA|nr:hypothetical protein RND71_026500 [Anisodus tanguticus]
MPDDECVHLADFSEVDLAVGEEIESHAMDDDDDEVQADPGSVVVWYCRVISGRFMWSGVEAFYGVVTVGDITCNIANKLSYDWPKELPHPPPHAHLTCFLYEQIRDYNKFNQIEKKGEPVPPPAEEGSKATEGPTKEIQDTIVDVPSGDNTRNEKRSTKVPQRYHGKRLTIRKYVPREKTINEEDHVTIIDQVEKERVVNE